MSDVCLRLIACLAILLGFALETCEAQRHRHVQTLKDKQLEKVVQLCTSPDGKHVHAVSYRPGHLLGFEIDQESGHLTKTSTVLKYQMVSLDVSKDQTRVVGASLMEDGKVTLYQRNPETGALRELHELYSEFVPELRRSIAVKFSPDGKFVFVACRTERFTILRIENDKLVLHQSLRESMAASTTANSLPATGAAKIFLYPAAWPERFRCLGKTKTTRLNFAAISKTTHWQRPCWMACMGWR